MATLEKASFLDGNSKVKANQGINTDMYRVAIVHKMIKDKTPFTLGTTAGGAKVYGVKFNDKTWPYQLTYSTTQKISAKNLKTESITKIFKGPNFGGGGKGTGGGVKETALTESGQAYYMSLVFNVKKKSLSCKDANDKNMAKAIQYVDATIPYEQFYEEGPEDWLNQEVYTKIANKVYAEYGGKLTAPVFCHRGSNFTKNIYKAKAVAHKHDRSKNGDNLAPGSFSNDKWNPGDIWLSSLSKTDEPLKGCKTFSELQKCVLDFSGEGQKNVTTVLPISLKKTGAKATLDKYNKWTDPKNRIHNKDGTIKYKGFTFGKGDKGDFFSSNDVYLTLGDYKMQLRGTSTTSGWQGSLAGARAYGGKCGGGNLNWYLEKEGKSITYKGNTTNDNWSEMNADKVNMKEFYKLYKTYLTLQDTSGAKKMKPIDSQELFEAEIIAQKKSSGKNAFIFNKNMGLMLIHQLAQLSTRKANDWATEVVRYAASNTDLSSFFIKVH